MRSTRSSLLNAARLREELALAKIEHHTEAVDELDIKGIQAFAERILPRAADL